MSRSFRLGVFIVLALLLFGTGVFWVGKSKMMFRAKYKLNADFQNVAGLANGADVRVAGIHEGTVRRIDLPKRSSQKVRVEMELDSATRRVVKKDSTATIHAEGLMGDEYVEISTGTDDAETAGDNATLQGQQPVEISDLLGKANGILDTAGGAMQNISQATGDLSQITSKINGGAGTVGALVNDKKMYQNMNKAASELQEDMEAVKHNFLLSHFFHQRGYEDTADLTKYEIGQLPSAEAVRRFSWPAQQIFDKADTAKLKDEKALSQAGAYLQSNPFGLAVVVGVSDMKGDTTTEKILTEARAMVVRDYLARNFKMDDTRLKTMGMGKSPAAETSGVLVLVYPPATPIPPPAAKSAEPVRSASK